ncbi:MAG: RidA family protein [Gammaproteobacteria bacterium]|nr:RidA family protein [Gammaproteobacteria bacterium]
MNQKNNNSTAPKAIWPGLEAGVPKPLMPYSPAIEAGGWVFIAGQLASDFKTGLDASVASVNPFLNEQLAGESDFVLGNLRDTIAATGCDINKDMVRIWQWFVSDRPTHQEFEQANNWPELSIAPYLEVRKNFIDACPPSSSLGVRELMWRDTNLEVDMICFADDEESITFGEPTGPGQHHPALRRGDWVFLASEGPVDWVNGHLTGSLVDGPSELAKHTWSDPDHWYTSTVEEQTRYTLEKLARLAEIAGTSLDQTVKAEVYIGHPQDFAAMDRVWRQTFPENPPARVVIPYMGMGAKGARVEISLTLLAGDASISKKTIETSDAPEQPGHEPQAVKAGNFLFFSTQMAFDSTGNLAEGMRRPENAPWYGSPGQNQMRYMMQNIDAISSAAGTSVENIVRRACFHSDLQWFAESIQSWASYFPGDKPASTTIGLDGPFVVPGANTLLDLISYVPD